MLTSSALRLSRYEDGTIRRRMPAFIRHSSATMIVGFFLTLTVVLMAILAPWLMPYDPNAVTATVRLAGPSPEHWMGSDRYGRDVFSRFLIGSQVSVLVGFISMTSVLIVGTIVGVLAGYVGGKLDMVVGRLVDVLLALPGILLAVAILAVLGPGLVNVCLAVAISQLPVMIRVVRGATLAVRQRQFVRAAGAIGATHLRIMTRHVLPYVLGIAAIQMTLGFADAVLYEAALSYLGIGVQPPEATWGNMISEAQSVLTVQPWNAIFPGLGLIMLLLGVNFLGDGLRDILDREGQGR